jgi:hypothetical protein
MYNNLPPFIHYTDTIKRKKRTVSDMTGIENPFEKCKSRRKPPKFKNNKMWSS